MRGQTRTVEGADVECRRCDAPATETDGADYRCVECGRLVVSSFERSRTGPLVAEGD